MLDFIRIACAVPPVRVGDVTKNVEDICAKIAQAEEARSDVIVFPETALTGYTCADLFFLETLQKACMDGLQKVIDFSAGFPDVTAVVGMPVVIEGQMYNCAAVVGGGRLHGIVPKERVAYIAENCAPPMRRDSRLLKALRRRDERKLRALSDAFAGLSEVCGAGDPAFGEQQLITKMRSALCAGCPEYARCWPGSDSGAIKLFCQLMTTAIECGTSPFRDGEVPPDIMRLCRRGMTVPARLGNMLAEFAAQRHRRIRLMEARRLIGAQFSQAAGSSSRDQSPRRNSGHRPVGSTIVSLFITASPFPAW